MAINITNNSTSKKEENCKSHCKSLCMEEIKFTAPYIYNFIQWNEIVRRNVAEGHISSCFYLNKGTESWYCFITAATAYGFHLSNGSLAEILNREEVINLLSKYSILYWDAIQRV